MRRLLSVLLVIAMMSAIVLSFPVTVSAESLYIRKIVSVVYDDSGSMKGDKWAYANYAMQAFCGMLNSEDQLFITYMSHSKQNSNYTPEKIDLSAGGIQDSVDSIRQHYSSSSTPYKAVEIAFDKLKSVQDSNPNTQYWLVVITDGEFDECSSMDDVEQKRYLNEEFKAFAQQTMPNGSNPQLTFLGIGSGLVSPDEDQAKGIYTYSATDAAGITGAMNQMADRISGRTRLQKSDMKKLDDNTIQISSSIPLLNIAVFAQGSEAKITKTVYSNEVEIPISRKASLRYANYADLIGGAYLLGDSQTVIGSGTYNITFDQKIDLDDVVILFEPALEMRMTVTLNGTVITDYSQLDQAMEGDQISVSCKIYEMGTNKEIDPALLPPGTRYEITVSEDGKVVEQSSGQEMELSSYVLKNIKTELTAAVIIEGFNPIDYTVKFTPTKYVPKVVYTIEPSFGGSGKSVKYDDIAGNKDMTVCFTVYADGTPITDPAAVRALNPVISVSPQGNSGTVSYSGDGKIIFTPNAASMPPAGADSFPVEVTCAIDDGTTASETYTVLIADYQVIAVDAQQAVKKTELFGNQVSVSFYIMKDGVKLDKAAVEQQIAIALNEEHADLSVDVAVSPDGTITVTPYSQQEHELTFWNWWINWAYYVGLEGADITVSLHHAYGSADSTIDVVGAGTKYVLLNVILPALIEFLLVAAIVAYIVRYVTKARFAENGVLYVGSISLNAGSNRTHSLFLEEVRLSQYNTFRNLWNPFKELEIEVGGVSITAAKGSTIICNDPFPWYCDGIKSKTFGVVINSPMDVVNYCEERDDLTIYEVKPTSVMEEQDRVIFQDESVYYFVDASIDYIPIGRQQVEVIDSAVAFCYTTLN